MNRYDYRYALDELAPYAEREPRLAREKRLVRVYFNNHPEGGAVANGREFVDLLRARGTPVEDAGPAPQRSLDVF